MRIVRNHFSSLIVVIVMTSISFGLFTEVCAQIKWKNTGAPIFVGGSARLPRVLCNHRGEVIVVFNDYFREGGNIYAQKVDANGNILWNPQGIPVVARPFEQMLLQATVSSDGGVIVAWLDGQIYLSKIRSNGTLAWSANGVQIASWNGGTPPNLIADNAGGAIISWYFQGGGFVQRVDSTGAIRWNFGGIKLRPDVRFVSIPALLPDGNGGAFIAWQTDATHDIHAQRINANGDFQWGNSIPVCTESGDQAEPQIVSDNAGGIVIGWTDYRRPSYEDIYTQRLNSQGNALWSANGKLVASRQFGDSRLAMVDDSNGGAIFSYTVGGFPDNKIQIWAQKVNSNGDVVWGSNGLAVRDLDTGDLGGPKICTDGAGGGIVVWNDPRLNWYVYAQKINAAGNPQWLRDGLPIAPVLNTFQDEQSLANDGLGGALVAWRDRRDPNAGIYAQRLNNSPTSVKNPNDSWREIPVDYFLSQNYPNPFNPTTQIRFGLPIPAEAKLEVYNSLGQRVAVLLNAKILAGYHVAEFDGIGLASGIYFYRLQADRFIQLRKMILLR